MQDLIIQLQDLRYLNWSNTKLSPGTPGCFLKAYEETDGRRYYYKLSNYDSYRGVFGHECVNELIASRLLDVLEIPHLQYQLIHARIAIRDEEIETWLTRSENFRKKTERKIPLDVYYEIHRQGNENPLEFMIRSGWDRYAYQMLLVDYLICNRDRHGANIEILVDEDGSARPAPLFDQGLSFLFSCYSDPDRIRHFDVMEDRTVNSFIGSRSPEYNLQLIPRGTKWFEGFLTPQDRSIILNELDQVLPQEHLNKIWEMILGRWNVCKNLCICSAC